MPKVKCPSCRYTTDDVEGVIAAAQLQAHTAASHNTSAPPVEKVKRPTLRQESTNEDWRYFTSLWESYADATKITGKIYNIQLLECCDEELRRDIHRTYGDLSAKPVKDVLEAIKKMAVQQENLMVARVKLHNMNQDKDESIRCFAARLRGQAAVCEFNIECPDCKKFVSYRDDILRDSVMRGLSDDETRLELLGDSGKEKSLEEVIRFVELRESGKRSVSNLSQTLGAEAARSSYRKATKDIQFKQKDQGQICTYCGKKGHGSRASFDTRKKQCEAFGHTCIHCGISHHYDNLCKNKNRKPSNNADKGEAIFNKVCNSSEQTKPNKALRLDHHIYNSFSKTWIRKASQQQPFVKVKVSTSKADYSSLGYKLAVPPRSTSTFGMADTGCQSCLAGPSLMRRLGLSKKHLIKVTMQMHAANSNGITILGCIIATISATKECGTLVESKQIIYISEDCNKLFLSRETCAALGIISQDFPVIGEAEVFATRSKTDEVDEVLSNDTGITAPCECPRREPPPIPPKELPYPATEANVTKLQEYLLDYYKSSTFNTCPHQPLPMMSGPPLRLMVNPDAKPVAFHTPVPVALHWMSEVKAGLDQDVRLGVIEKVPIGEPVTWCHRMVVCAKKNGKPRRTVDFQPLNKHCTRETHHTQSPFHQARSIPGNTRKTVFDAWNGYHSVPLHVDDRHLTTFITPWGRYRYRVAPQGYIASGDGYSRRYDEIVADIPNKTKCIDDTLLWSSTIKDSFLQAVQWLYIL